MVVMIQSSEGGTVSTADLLWSAGAFAIPRCTRAPLILQNTEGRLRPKQASLSLWLRETVNSFI
jgi:hypothetical protein